MIAGVAASFTCLAGTIVYLMEMHKIEPAAAKLMLVALFAMYVGIGILIAIYRLIEKLE